MASISMLNIQGQNICAAFPKFKKLRSKTLSRWKKKNILIQPIWVVTMQGLQER